MKRFARVALKLLTLGIPCVIAACYGMVMTYRSGRVVDAQSKAGIPGITVLCMAEDSYAASEADGGMAQAADGGAVAPPLVEVARDTTGPAGQFVLALDYQGCKTVVAQDVDGEANGGKYATASVVYEYGESEIVVPMVKE